MGKKKIAIEKIESKNKRQVTFSKRRKGLFQKAADLCILCDAKIAIVVFSPAGRPYTFGHSSVDSVIDRYLNGSNQEQEERSRFWWELIDLDEYVCMEKLQTLENRLEKVKEKVLRRAEELASSRTATSNDNGVDQTLLISAAAAAAAAANGNGGVNVDSTVAVVEDDDIDVSLFLDDFSWPSEEDDVFDQLIPILNPEFRLDDD